ncbi:MAG: translesion DNA synthesis-associated protein ImuA [Rhodanobacteraceae bacterium]|nr:translesion DNA synthesis-associated protein ImuA [Rhodanobacteraceae bacterium]MBP9155199.1 translesion DNA synthesis-associated protein ImuA [Xanthomonadales bacterium]HQW81431.1 translesion DNA synthesis-associated protein ImuA [Pseudomonadota bacterium]
MAATIESLLARADVWRAGERHATTPTLASGHRELDAVLPGGGWPLQALTEICHARPGLGELSLMLPAFARAMDEQRWLLFVSAPHRPYAPALAAAGIDLERFAHLRCTTTEQALWAAEQALRSGVCGALALWLGHCDANALRRLQLAAEVGRSLAVLYRPLAHADQASPAALRIALDGEHLRIVKCRGALGEVARFVLRRSPHGVSVHAQAASARVLPFARAR